MELPGDESLGEFWLLVIVMTSVTVVSAIYMRRRGWL